MDERALVSRQMKAGQRKYGERLHAIKIHGGSPYQARGISDIIVCLDGIFGAIETKMPGKEKNVSDNQAAFLKKVKDAGGFTAICTTVPQFMEVLKKMAKKAKVGA